MSRRLLPLVLAVVAGLAGAADGKAVYEANCASCHQPDGAGADGLAPPLQGTLGKRLAVRQYVPGIVLSGLAGKMVSKGVTYTGMMPSWAHLPDTELAAVVNHVLATFNAADLPAAHTPFTAEDFAALRASKPTARQLRAWRAETD
jgi:mono/diheme cytochrome c family protein